jgi:hypothetical protein
LATSLDNESISGEDNLLSDVRRRSLVVAMIAFELALFLLTVSLGVAYVKSKQIIRKKLVLDSITDG